MNILLVDHTPLYRDILQHALAHYRGIQLSFAHSAAEAEALLAGQRFQFFILGWQLPDDTGINLARRWRQNGSVPFEPIVLLTASASAELALEATQAGITELFRKQDIDELVTFMRHFLGIYNPLPCRVIYVEDVGTQRMALEAELQSWGMSVDAFASAEEAWEALQRQSYDLAICDVVLAGRMSGTRFINRIRRQPGELGRMLILAATAFDNPARRIELFHLGIDDYIAKPIVPLELKARLHNLLSRKRATEQNRQLLQASDLAVLVIDEGGHIVAVQGKAESLFGDGEAALIGQPLSRLLPEWPGFADAAPASAPPRLRLNALHRDGRVLPVEISCQPLLERDAGTQLALL
ncbi:MAG: hypothetical protein RIR00_1001, partial [Pseudomonadota bacterium]